MCILIISACLNFYFAPVYLQLPWHAHARSTDKYYYYYILFSGFYIFMSTASRGLALQCSSSSVFNTISKCLISNKLNIKYALSLPPFLRWLDREGNNKTRWNFPDRSDILESTLPHMTWWCRLSLVLSSLWSGLRLLVLIGMSGAFLVGVAGWYMVAREQERKHVYLMVDRVLGERAHGIFGHVFLWCVFNLQFRSFSVCIHVGRK